MLQHLDQEEQVVGVVVAVAAAVEVVVVSKHLVSMIEH